MRLVLVSVSEPGANVLWGSSEERLWVRLCVLGDGTRRDVYYVKLSEIQQVLFVLSGHWCVGDVNHAKSDCNMVVCRMWQGKNRIRKNAWSGIYPCIDSAFSILRFSQPLLPSSCERSGIPAPGTLNYSPLLWSDAQPQERLLSRLLSIINLCYSCKSKAVFSSRRSVSACFIDVENETKPSSFMLSEWLILARRLFSEV